MHPWPNALRRFILHRWTRYVLCWLIALGLTGLQLHIARHMFDESDRRDGNKGHVLIDFGGQWLIAHMLAIGRGHELYSRSAQREVLDASYPQADEAPDAKDHDAGNLMQWLMDIEPAYPGEPPLGGPLYPPTHALMFAPLGALPPQQSYKVAQVLFLLSAWVAGLAIAGISRGRIWWPVATTFVMVFPGFGPALHLAQNSALSLAIVLVGWWFVSRGWEVAGGIAWGLLAYKPVWAVAFLLVPLLTRRWRMVLAMTATGLALILATLPFVGIDSWLHWIRVGRTAATVYNVDENWVFMSRDLLGIPRRWMLNFAEAKETRDRFAPAVVGWTIWATVLLATAVVALRRRAAVSGVDGYGAAFVAIGAWATCFHFIGYDSLLAAFPVVLLLTEPRRFIQPVLLALAPAPRTLAAYFAPRPVTGLPPPATVPVTPMTAVVLNSFVLTAVALLILIEQSFGLLNISASVSVGLIPEEYHKFVLSPMKFSTGQSGTPWDTFVMLALWAFCGARVLMGIGESELGECPASPGH
jgi:hypothetical protein